MERATSPETTNKESFGALHPIRSSPLKDSETTTLKREERRKAGRSRQRSADEVGGEREEERETLSSSMLLRRTDSVDGILKEMELWKKSAKEDEEREGVMREGEFEEETPSIERLRLNVTAKRPPTLEPLSPDLPIVGCEEQRPDGAAAFLRRRVEVERREGERKEEVFASPLLSGEERKRSWIAAADATRRESCGEKRTKFHDVLLEKSEEREESDEWTQTPDHCGKPQSRTGSERSRRDISSGSTTGEGESSWDDSIQSIAPFSQSRLSLSSVSAAAGSSFGSTFSPRTPFNASAFTPPSTASSARSTGPLALRLGKGASLWDAKEMERKGDDGAKDAEDRRTKRPEEEDSRDCRRPLSDEMANAVDERENSNTSFLKGQDLANYFEEDWKRR